MYKDEIIPKQTSKTLEDLPKIIKENTEEINCKQRAGKSVRHRAKLGISLPVMAEVKDIEGIKLNKINCKQKTYEFKLVNGLPVMVEVKDDGTDCKQKPRHRDKLVVTEITDDKPKELAVSKEVQDKEEENRVKFEKLVSFLKTLPKVEASEEEKKLMSIIDNDEEDQLRIKKIIEERRRLNV